MVVMRSTFGDITAAPLLFAGLVAGGAAAGMFLGDIAQKLASTDKLHDWFVEKGIDVKLISDQSFISNKFERIQLKDIS